MNFNGTKFYALLMLCAITPFASFAQSAKSTNDLSKKTMHRPLVFVENKGQVTDLHNHMRKDVDYTLEGKGMNVFVANNALHYQFNMVSYDKAKNNNNEVATIKSSTVNSYRMDVQLIGANKDAKAMATDKQEYTERYIYPQFGQQGLSVHSYQKITYKNVYPNIDWVLFVKNNKLEYDFIVHPGGHVKDIKLRYNGANTMSLNKEGNVVLTSPLGRVNEEKPFTYQQDNGQEIASNFNLKKNILSFDVAQHDGTIVIDPQVNWSTYFGGALDDEVNGVATDNAGNVYITGYTASGLHIATSGSHMSSYGTGGDAFLAKFNSSGGIIWSTYFGSTGNEQANAIAVDGANNIYIAGQTMSSSNFATSGVYQTTYGGASGTHGTGDGFLAKFNSDDSLIWCTYYGGKQDEICYGLACDKFGYVYIGGTTTSDSAMTSTGAYDTTYNHGATGMYINDLFLARFDSSGHRKWGTYYGGSKAEGLQGMTCDAAGNVYFTGYSSSTDYIASTGAFKTTLSGGFGGGYNAILVKFDSTGNRVWGTYYGGNGTYGSAIIYDTAGYVYFAGNTTSNSQITTTGSYQSTYGGGGGPRCSGDAFLIKFTTSGNRSWGTYYGGSGCDNAYGLTLDNFDNIVVVGETNSNSGIATTDNGSSKSTFADSTDAYIAKFTPFGQRLWGSYLGGTDHDGAYACAFSPYDGSLYMGGYTYSLNNIATSGTFHTSLDGQMDGFLTRFYQDTIVVVSQPFVDTLLCPGSMFDLPYSTTYSFNSGNTFTAQLSDASGSFASPTNIGTANATTPGTISCTIPISTTTGNGYRIRVIASNPAFTSPDDYYNIRIINSVPTNPIATSNTPVCIGDTIKLSVTSSTPGPLYYTWFGPASFSSTQQNPMRTGVTTSMAGTYKVAVSHDGCPADTTTTTVVVNTTFPIVPTDSSNSPVCDGGTLKLYGKSTTSGVTYSWTGPLSFYSTLQNPTITSIPVSGSGYYTVTANLNGCKSRDSLYAEVDPLMTPIINITPDAGDTICAGDPALFSSSVLFGGTDPKYQWYVNGVAMVGALSDVWGSPYLNNGDVIYCLLTSNFACVTNNEDTSNKITVVVNPIESPTVFIYAHPGTSVAPGTTITFKSIVTNAGTSPTYQWRVNGVDVPGEVNPTFVSSTLGIHDVVSLEVHSNSPCASPDSALSNVLNLTLGVAELAQGTDLNLYPNPTSGSFTVQASFTGIQENKATIEVYNLVGQMIYQQDVAIQGSELKHQINLNSNVPNGMYIMRMNVGKLNNVVRFTVQR